MLLIFIFLMLTLVGFQLPRFFVCPLLAEKFGFALSRKIAANGQSLLLCWYFLMSSPELLLIEN
jgi:hypothetical protein